MASSPISTGVTSGVAALLRALIDVEVGRGERQSRVLSLITQDAAGGTSSGEPERR